MGGLAGVHAAERAPAREGGATGRRSLVVCMVGVALLTIGGAAVRVWYLDEPMRFDEAFTVTEYAAKPLIRGWAEHYYPNNHLLHTAMVHVSIRGVGFSETGARLPALLAGILLIPATFVVGRRLYGDGTGLLSAALVAGSSILIEFSTNARGYTLLCLCTLWGVCAGAGCIERGRWRDWLSLAGAGTVGLVTLPPMLYPLGGLGLWVLVSVWPERARRGELMVRASVCAGVMLLGTAMAYLPVVWVSGVEAIVANRFVRPMGWSAYIDAWWVHNGELLGQWHRDWPGALGALLGIGALTAILKRGEMGRFRQPVLLWMIIWAIPLATLMRVVYVSPRIWLWLLPVYLLTGSAGLVWWGRALMARMGERWSAARLAAVGVVSGVLLAGGLMALVVRAGSIRTSEETGVFRSGPAVMARILEAKSRPRSVVCSNSSLVPLYFHFMKHGLDVRILTGDPVAPPVWVVVDNDRQETVRDVLRWKGIEDEALHAAVAGASWEMAGAARVYVLPRRVGLPHVTVSGDASHQ